MRVRGLILGLGALLAAGCGTHGGGFPQTSIPSRPAMEIGMPGASGVGIPDERAIALLFEMGRAVKVLPGASYEAVTFSRGSVGTKPKGLPVLSDGSWQAATSALEVFRAPAEYRVDLANDGDPRHSGYKLHITGDAVELRAPGWRGALLGHGHLNDFDLLDFRGQRRDATDFVGLVRRLSGAASAHYIGDEDLDGAVLQLVEIPRAPQGDAGVTREVVGLDANTHLPLLVRRYAKTTLVFERKLRSFNVVGKVAAVDLAI